MCGRYYIDKRAESALPVDAGLGPGDTLGWREFLKKSAGDVCPSQQAPVLTGEGGELHLELMTWGFLPPSGEQKRDGKVRPGGLLINARAETALEKRMFRDSIRSRRCVIPAGHFYEWDEDRNRAEFSVAASLHGGILPVFSGGEEVYHPDHKGQCLGGEGA